MKTSTIESKIGGLIARRQLARIEITSSDGLTFAAIAYPAPWSAIVTERRQAAFNEAMAGSSFPPLSIADATAISDKAAGDAIARQTAGTIAQAIAALDDALAALAKVRGEMP